MIRALTRPQWLVLAYPLLVHLAIVTGSGMLTWLALAALAVNVLAPWLAGGRLWPWAALAGALVAGGLLSAGADARLFLYAAPALIALALAWFFARTLLPGETPMISRIAALMRGPLPAPVARYTRGVTLFWALFMLALAVADLALAVWARPVVWSLFTNVVCYLLIGAVFVLEWLFRCWYLRGHESLDARGYLVALLRLDYRRLFLHG